MAALTLKIALANAQTVYDKKGTHCLNENFEPDTDLSRKASHDKLLAKIKALGVPDDNKEKKRLLVIIRLTNPPDEKPKVEAPKKGPKTLEDFKAEVIKMYVAAPASPEQMAKQKQKELSLLLLAHEFLQFEKVYAAELLKSSEALTRTCMKSMFSKETLDDPETFALIVLYFKGSFKKDPKGGELTFYTILDHPPKYFDKMRSLLSHSNQNIREIASELLQAKELSMNSPARKMDTKYFDSCDEVRKVLSDDIAKKILEQICPELIEVFLFIRQGYRLINLGICDPKFFTDRVAMKHDLFEANFQKKYQELHTELMQIQAKHFSDKKEFFLKRFCRRLDKFLLSVHKTSSFPVPGSYPTALEFVESFVGKLQAKPLKVDQAPAKKPKEAEPKKEDVSPLQSVFAKRGFLFSEVDYDKRVLEWFDKREAAPFGFTPEDAVWKHAFTRIVDKFIGTSYSFRDTWKNEKTGNDDPCFCILADITFPSKQTVSGVFQFTFDKNWVCYHRWFGPMSNIERLDKLISQKRDKIAFPPLRKPAKPNFEEIDSTQFSIDPFFDSVTFKDAVNGLTIKIYKVEE